MTFGQPPPRLTRAPTQTAMTEQYDAIVIGTGQAGPSMAHRCAKEGLRTLVVERGRVGGTCVNVGCTPTKALVASARVAHMARRSSDFGVEVEGIEVDMRSVLRRARRIAAESGDSVLAGLEKSNGITFVRGHGRFVAPGEIEVLGERYAAPKIFVNVGGRARLPMEIPEDLPVLTNASVLELETQPEHLIVLGGSYIGLEFAQVFRRLGSRVTVLQRGEHLIPRDDPDVSLAVRGLLESEGIDVQTSRECVELVAHSEGVEARSTCPGTDDRASVTGSHVLVATGRIPNTGDLGLDEGGLRSDKRGFLVTDEFLETSSAGVFALGDCNGRGAFTHTAYNDYEIVAGNLFDGEQRSAKDRLTCYGLFVDPPLGRVGMTEAEARETGRPVLVGKLPMTRVGRARERGETGGFMKILVDAESRLVLGAAILGIRGDEAAQTLLAAMVGKLTADDIMRTVWIHPTVTELIPSALQGLTPLAAE